LDCSDEALPGNVVDGEVEKKTETVYCELTSLSFLYVLVQYSSCEVEVHEPSRVNDKHVFLLIVISLVKML